MLDIENNNLLKHLENKTHYVIDHKNFRSIFNSRIIKRYDAYYKKPTVPIYNLHLLNK